MGRERGGGGWGMSFLLPADEWMVLSYSDLGI